MGLSQLEICNQALLKVGADTIDTLTPPVSTEDGTKRSIDLCNIFFDQAYEEILRIYPWNSATKRDNFELQTVTEYPRWITATEDGVEILFTVLQVDGEDSITNGKPSYNNEDQNRSIDFDGTKWIYRRTDSSSYNSLANDSTNITPPRTGWYIDTTGISNTPLEVTMDYSVHFGYDNVGEKPSDMIRLINCFRYEDQRDQRTSWVLEGDYILANEDKLYIRYIAKPNSTEDLEPLCTNALICNLALKLCTALQLDDNWAARINNELYGQILPQARSIDTFENKELLLEESDWIIYRNYDAPRM